MRLDWSPAEDAVLTAGYLAGLSTDAIELAVSRVPGSPGRSTSSIYCRANLLGLRRSAEYMATLRARKSAVMRGGRFRSACALTPRPLPSDAISDPAEFIARFGVTRCPAAACAPTTASIDPADSAAIRAHDDALPVDGDWKTQRRRDWIASGRGAVR